MAKFQKGKSGNPGGRPQATASAPVRIAVQNKALEHAVEAIETLVARMNDSEATAASRISAAIYVIERAIGKPSERAEASNDTRRELSLSDLLERRRGLDFMTSPIAEAAKRELDEQIASFG